jgi:putative ABC transport system substrate-binding protein
MPFDQLHRRKFIMLLGGVAGAPPLAARAQQPERMRRIGVLMGYPDSDAAGQAYVAAFREGQHPDRLSLGVGIRRGIDATIREGTRRATARPHSFA